MTTVHLERGSWLRRAEQGAPLLVCSALALLALGCRASAGAASGYQGIVEFDESTLSFEVPGKVETIAVERGGTVKQGQVLASLDDELATLRHRARDQERLAVEAELAQLRVGARVETRASLLAQVRSALAKESLAERTEQRTQSLHKSGSVREVDVERAKSELESARFRRVALQEQLKALNNGATPEEVERLTAKLEAARSAAAIEEETLRRHSLQASVSGRVLDVLVRPGEFVQPGAPAAVVADVTHPYADVFVPQGEMDGIRPGTKALVRVDGSGSAVKGQVESVGSKVEFTPRFLFSDAERPLLVMRVRVRIDDEAEALTAGLPAFVQFAR